MSLVLTQSVVEKILDGRYNSFREAFQDAQYTSGSPLAVAATTEILLTNNGLGLHSVTSPDYITSRWDATNSKFVVPEELDNPTYVNDISFVFDPSVAAAGKATLRVYIDESGTRNFAVDPVIRTLSSDYKATPELISQLVTWFMGDGAGYDAKNNGVYFTVEFSAAGNLYETYMSIYRT